MKMLQPLDNFNKIEVTVKNSLYFKPILYTNQPSEVNWAKFDTPVKDQVNYKLKNVLLKQNLNI
jgi:hypothetical protein